MSVSRKIAVIVGSLRKDLITRLVAKSMIDVAPETLKPEFLEIGQLPLSQHWRTT